MEHFNQLTPAEAERLAILSEECGEVIQAIGKILRHGYESTHPDGGPSNRQSLEKELGDVYAIAGRMALGCDISWTGIIESANGKNEKLDIFTHHQETQYEKA